MGSIGSYLRVSSTYFGEYRITLEKCRTVGNRQTHISFKKRWGAITVRKQTDVRGSRSTRKPVLGDREHGLDLEAWNAETPSQHVLHPWGVQIGEPLSSK